jgi:hypothetical protein
MDTELDPPRCVDAFGVLARNLQRHLEKYPKGALIPRTELITLPVTDEASFGKIDAALTQVMYDAAVAMRSVTDDDFRRAAQHAINPPRQTFKSFRTPDTARQS